MIDIDAIARELAEDIAIECGCSMPSVDSWVVTCWIEKAIQRVADDVAPKWLPIDENTPRDRQILVYSPKYGEQFVVFWGVNPVDGDGKWVLAIGKDVTFIVSDAKFWKPLPAPPTKGDA